MPEIIDTPAIKKYKAILAKEAAAKKAKTQPKPSPKISEIKPSIFDRKSQLEKAMKEAGVSVRSRSKSKRTA